MTEETTSPRIFLNGKGQVIEMLQLLDSREKDLLLRNIRLRDPVLANELTEESITFQSIKKLSDHEIRLLLQYITPSVLGLALKNLGQDQQRRILAIAPRNYAEEAYSLLLTPTTNEKNNIKKAQNKITSVMLSLSRNKQINL